MVGIYAIPMAVSAGRSFVKLPAAIPPVRIDENRHELCSCSVLLLYCTLLLLDIRPASKRTGKGAVDLPRDKQLTPGCIHNSREKVRETQGTKLKHVICRRRFAQSDSRVDSRVDRQGAAAAHDIKNTNDAAAAEDTIITAGESKWTQQRRQIPYTAQVSLQAGIQDYHNNASLSLLHML